MMPRTHTGMLLVLVTVVAGCGTDAPSGAREVPAARPGASGRADDQKAATTPPRAIATH